jgi:hypothetical protein
MREQMESNSRDVFGGEGTLFGIERISPARQTEIKCVGKLGILG